MNPSVNLSPYNMDAADIERRRRMAEALSMQGMQPLETNQMAGGYVIPVSPLQGLAKMLQSGIGAMGQRRADEEERALMQRMRTEGAADVSKFVEALRGTPAVPANMDVAPGDVPAPEQPAVPGDKNRALAIALGSGNPMLQGAGSSILANMLKPGEWKLGERFNPTTGREEKFMYNPADPTQTIAMGGQKAEKVIGENLGGTMQYRGEFGTQPLATAAMTPTPNHTTPSADSAARLRWDQYRFENLSAEERARLQNEAQRLGVSVAELMFNTGQGPAGAGARLPQNAPMPSFGQPGFAPTQSPAQMTPQSPRPVAPSPTPQAVAPRAAPQAGMPSGLSPKAAMEVATERAKMEGKRTFNMGGLNDALDAATALLSGTAGKPVNGIPTASSTPTSSFFGSLADSALGAFGVSTKGADAAAQLKSLGGKLVTMMPRMEGPQSDKDVILYREMAGRVGDDSVPLSQRLAAINTIRELYGKYEGGAPRGGASGGWKIERQ